MQKGKNTRVNQQIKQISKSLLVDFKKTRTKCLQLTTELNIEVDKNNFYSNIQRTTLMKCELLDLAGLVKLKNSLVKTLGQLFQLEREYVYQKQKRQAQQKMKKQNKIPINYEPAKPAQNFEPVQRKQSRLQSVRSSRASEMQSSRRVEVPFYRIDNQAVENVQTKLDRVSKFIASLKKSIKGASQTAGYKFRTRQYLLEQNPYIRAKAQLEKYFMREQELEKIFADAIRQQLQAYFNNNATLSPNGQYYLVKVPKPKPFVKKVADKKLSPQQCTPVKNFQQILSKPVSPPGVMPHVEAQVDADFQAIKVDLQKKSENYAQLFLQMSQTVEKGNQRLSEIRQKRKLAFQKDDQLWNEL